MKINNTSLQTSRMNNKQAALTAQNPSFGGKGLQFVKDLVEPERVGTMGRWLFLGTAFVFLLGGRIIGSRDKNEKRETITRDVPSIVIIAGAVPIIEKFLSKHIQKHTGFAILGNAEEKKAQDIYAEIKAGTKDASAANDLPKQIISYAQLKTWYTFDENLASGFKGFSERLSNLGGNLKKIYSKLGDKFKEDLKGLSDDNKTFMAELFDTKNETLLNKIKDAFKDKKGNEALKQAEFIKASPKLISIAGTLALLGIFVPVFNIWLTEQVNKKEGQASKKV